MTGMARIAPRRAAAGPRLRDGRRVRQRLLRPRDTDRPVRDRGSAHRAVPGDNRAPGTARSGRENALAAADRASSRRSRPGIGNDLITIRDPRGTDSCGWMDQLAHPAARIPWKGGRRDELEIVVAVVFPAWEDQPADFEVKLLGVGEKVHHAQRLFLAGRFQDEL